MKFEIFLTIAAWGEKTTKIERKVRGIRFIPEIGLYVRKSRHPGCAGWGTRSFFQRNFARRIWTRKISEYFIDSAAWKPPASAGGASLPYDSSGHSHLSWQIVQTAPKLETQILSTLRFRSVLPYQFPYPSSSPVRHNPCLWRIAWFCSIFLGAGVFPRL